MAERDVADHVVDRQQHLVRRDDVIVLADVTGSERTVVAGAVDEGMEGVTVSLDRRHPDRPVLVADPVRRGDATSVTGGRLGIGVVDVGDRERDRPDTVAVTGMMGGDLGAGAETAGQDEPDPALLENVRYTVSEPGLEAGVRNPAESEGVLVEVSGLGGVADVELDVVDAVERHVIVGCGGDGRSGSEGHRFMILWLMQLFNPCSLRLKS